MRFPFASTASTSLLASLAILVAGSLRAAPGDAPVGGLWVVEADTRDEAEAVYATDPFWTEGLRDRVEIHFWSKALPGRVPV